MYLILFLVGWIFGHFVLSGSGSGRNVEQLDIADRYFTVSITVFEHECFKIWLAQNHLQAIAYIQTSIYYALHYATTQIIDISTLHFICKLCNFMHIISMQNSGAAITLSVSGWICGKIPGHIQIQFLPGLKN